MNTTFFLPQFRNLSLRTKLLLSILSITAISVILFGYFFYVRTQQSQALLNSELKKTVNEQSEQQLNNIVLAESRFFDQTLSNVTSAIHLLSDYQTSLYTKKAVLADGSYWSAQEYLIQFSDGQFGNSSRDTSSIFIPNTVTTDNSIMDDLNLNIYLNFNAPSVLGNSSDIVGLYFVSERGYTIYYPNIELAKVAPPDFDPRTQQYYVKAAPEQNPQHLPFWTTPYQDTAGAGLIVTNSLPVYDNLGKFRGVLGADVQLSTITKRILEIKAGISGFAFMIDQEGHIISLPEAGYKLLGTEPEIVPQGETPKETIFEKGPEEFQNITRTMGAGNQGVATVTLQGTTYYVAYAPLPTTGYSLGLLVPVAELDASYIATSNKIAGETQGTINQAAIILLGILLSVSVIAVVLSRNISRPLVNLTNIAEQVKSGNLNVQVPVETSDEIGTLAQTFNSMSTQLRESFSSMEKRVADRTRDLSIVSEVSTTTATILDFKKLLQEVVDLTKDRFNLYHSHIYLLDEEGKNLVLTAGAGEPGRLMVAEGRSIPLDREQSLVARAARERKGVTVNDVTQAPDFLPNPLLPDTRSELAVPMLVGGNVIGVFDIQSEQAGRFTDSDVNIQTTLAAQLATSIQNVRSFEQSKKQADLETLVNKIGQKIQQTTSIEETLQTAIRELGTAIGATRVKANLASTHQSDGNSPSSN
ncbi:MAG: cache domain-containing protein [Anaerolineales bacterium]